MGDLAERGPHRVCGAPGRQLRYFMPLRRRDGRREMQAYRREYDYGQRAEYLVARLASSRMKRSTDWEKAPTVYQISVLDFEYVPQSGVTSTDPVSRYAMRTKDGRELANALNIEFIELPKVAK